MGTVARTYPRYIQGALAALGGALRVVTSFLPAPHTLAVHATYLTIDVCLFVALAGLLGRQHGRVSRWGQAGALVALAGSGLLVVDDVGSATLALSPTATVVFAAGLCVVGVASWVARTLPRWIPTFWLTATVVGGLGYGIRDLGVLFQVAGVIFGVSFIGLGVALVRWSAASLGPATVRHDETAASD